ncbi:MAG: LAGLIDADG family homing endonuclease [Candidatus Paceibacterota bacterium]
MRRGSKPKGKVRIQWSSNFAYAIGLLAADGCLSKDGRHIDVTSNDYDQLENFIKALDIDVKITQKSSGRGYTSWHVQFSDVLFYKFLTEIGITSAKSKTLRKLDIPDEYFFDFLRGEFDGDGHFYSYWDKRWTNSYMFYLTFIGASQKFLEWISQTNERLIGIKANVIFCKKSKVYQLRYAKESTLEIINKMYYTSSALHLRRKKKKIDALVVPR